MLAEVFSDMKALLLSLIPGLGSGLAWATAAAGAVAAFFIRGKIAQVQEKRSEARMAKAVVENHQVATQETAAETDEEADAALDAAAHADRN